MLELVMHSTRTIRTQVLGHKHIKQLLEAKSRVTNSTSLNIIHKITTQIFYFPDIICAWMRDNTRNL